METVKQVTLILDNSWISGIEIHRVCKSSVRKSEVEWRLWYALEENRECVWVKRGYL